jgi:hypothetical protein
MPQESEARLSNTGLPNRDAVRLVGHGVDTFILNVYASEETVEQLCAGWAELRDRELARAEEAKEEPQAIALSLAYGGQPLYLLPYARKGWRFVLHNELLDVQIGRGGASKISARMRLSAAYLWSRDFGDSITEAYRFVFDAFGEKGVRVQAGELHLAVDLMGVDFSTAAAWAALEPSFVHRAATFGPLPAVHGKLSTIQIGQRSNAVSGVIYNKSAELAKSGKLWFHDIWRANGWDGEAPVWRLELRFRREFLHQAKIEDAYDLLDRMGQIWNYGTHQWVRHVDCDPEASADVRQEAPLSAWWSVYAGAWQTEADATPITRERKHQADQEKLALQAFGCLVSWFALSPCATELEMNDLLSDLSILLREAAKRKDKPIQTLIAQRIERYRAAA